MELSRVDKRNCKTQLARSTSGHLATFYREATLRSIPCFEQKSHTCERNKIQHSKGGALNFPPATGPFRDQNADTELLYCFRRNVTAHQGDHDIKYGEN